MKKSEVTKKLNEGFQIKLNSQQFRKWKFGFIYENNDFYFDFGYSSASYDTCFPTTFYYGVGSNNVKEILKRVFPENLSRPENTFPKIFSQGQKELFEEKKYPIFKYDIYSEDDVNKMINQVSDYLIKEALPYLRSISNLEVLEKMTNHLPLNPWKKDVGLILSKLVSNPTFESLKNQYRELLKDWSDWDKQELEKLIDFLDKHSCTELLKMAE
jgi:hypothetical protein